MHFFLFWKILKCLMLAYLKGGKMVPFPPQNYATDAINMHNTRVIKPTTTRYNLKQSSTDHGPQKL